MKVKLMKIRKHNCMEINFNKVIEIIICRNK